MSAALCAGQAPRWDSVIAGEPSEDRKSRLELAKATCRRCELRDRCLADGLAGRGGGVLGGRHFPDRLGLLLVDDRAQRRTARPPCGTPGGAKAHRDRGEPVDEACAEAYRAANRDRMAAQRAAAKETDVA